MQKMYAELFPSCTQYFKSKRDKKFFPYSNVTSLLQKKNSPLFKPNLIWSEMYELFQENILAVEAAFTTASKKLQFMSLVSLCEGCINHLLQCTRISLCAEDEYGTKRWLTFSEKIHTVLLCYTACPIKELNYFTLSTDTYQSLRNLVIHGDPTVQVTEENVEVLLDLAKHLLHCTRPSSSYEYIN